MTNFEALKESITIIEARNIVFERFKKFHDEVAYQFCNCNDADKQDYVIDKHAPLCHRCIEEWLGREFCQNCENIEIHCKDIENK